MNVGFEKVEKGLENIAIKETCLSNIDGEKGKLYYVGYSIEELAEYSSYEEVCFLLLNGRLPTRNELEKFSAMLVSDRSLPRQVVDALRTLPRTAPLMSWLKTGVDLLSLYDQDAEKTDDESRMRTATRLISKVATLTAAAYRLARGLEPVEPSPELSHAGNFLYMVKGSSPSPLEEKIMDVAFILHAEHELPASTTAALVVASTLSDLYSAVSAGIGALKGPLHGGANERALEMLQTIGSPDKADEYVANELAAKRRIMGFGHRVYRSFDPRARIFKRYLEQLSERTGDKTLLQIAEAVENAMMNRMGGRNIFPNIDLYSGPVFHLLGLGKEIFTPFFAAARTVGWIAHVLEYWRDNRLIRPRAVYVGPEPRSYIPLDRR
ncbi:MAG: citrate synthase/methylcitrate synthase [Aigarchaeota archaeon]|nr:citrate synthase/methylcitrate synthase [Candidatus Caldarchaeales archaeon]MDJ0273071.1 citrate synthase/methylcitrate synthase [Candidatus Caldarchaeales archaeon]